MIGSLQARSFLHQRSQAAPCASASASLRPRSPSHRRHHARRPAASAGRASTAAQAASPSLAAPSTGPAVSVAPGAEVEVRPGILEGYWIWQGHRIRYQRSGEAGPAVLCVHGAWGGQLPGGLSVVGGLALSTVQCCVCGGTYSSSTCRGILFAPCGWL